MVKDLFNKIHPQLTNSVTSDVWNFIIRNLWDKIEISMGLEDHTHQTNNVHFGGG